MTVRALKCTKDSIIRSPNFGSGQDVHNIAGDEAGATVMSLLDFEALPSGIITLNYARLYMKRSTGSPPTGHDTPDNGATVIPGRITGDWNEGSHPTAGFGAHTYSSGNSVVYPGPSVTQELSARGSQATSGWWYIDVKDIVTSWLGGSAKKGIRIKSGNGTSDICFDSRHAAEANRPYLELSYNTNSPPNTPTGLTPTGGALQGSTSGTSLSMTARHTDPDGDNAVADWFQVYPDSSTDGSLGTPLKNVYDSAAVTPHNTTRTRVATGLPARTFVKWRCAFRDASAWGAWSLLQRAKTAYVPSAPGQPAVTAGTVTPDFFGSIVGSDSADFITAAEVVVYQDPAAGQTITKWASGKQTIGGSPTRFQLAYGGTALVFGTQYRWKARVWNRDDVASPWTANQYFTPGAPAGPNISPSDTGTKQNTVTPTFTLTRIGGGNFDRYRMRFYSEAGTLLHDTGEVSITSASSTPVVTPAGLWDWGQQPHVDAAIRNTGDANIGPFSELKTIKINSTPGSPTGLVVTDATVVTRDDGVVVADFDEFGPALEVPFRDTDLDLGYVEYPTLREIEVRDLAFVVLAELVQKTYARKDDIGRAGNIYLFEQEASLVPTSMGWVAGTSCALSWATAILHTGAASLKLAFTSLATATTSTQTLIDGLRLSTLYTNLNSASVTTFRIACRKSASPAGLAVKLRFIFSGSAANFAEFDITPTASGTFEVKTLTKASPSATGGTVNWAQVSGLELRVSHTAGSNQSFDIYVDSLQASLWPTETQRRARARYDDSAATRSAWSDYFNVKRSAIPTLSGVTPAAATTVTDPTTTFAWTMASAGGKVQDSYRLRVFSGPLSGSEPTGSLLYDSGLVEGTANSHTLPPGILMVNGATPSWTLDVYDSDGLAATQIARQFTTSFTQPPDITGLAVAVDADSSSMLVTWNASGLAADEFYAYHVEYRVAGDWIRIATITAQASTMYRFRGAPHNVEVQIRVVVDNGYMESPGATVVLATLTKDGYWRVDPNAVAELRYVQPGGHSGEPRTLVEEFDPPFGGTIVQTWGTAGYRGQFRMFVPPDAGILEMLREDKRLGRTVALKFWRGDVRYSKIKSVPDTVREAGYTDVELSYVEVTPTEADYGAVETA